ncbi:MAG TPA: signal peptidase II [Oceanospirillaceae bacterium]|jgi:signal peptidase II|nr:signal peptidase II [Oceanospirillaceae bacterium]
MSTAQVRRVNLPNNIVVGPTAWQRLWLWVPILWGTDLLLKFWVSSQLAYAERINLMPIFDLTLLHNRGAAFSFLADQGGWQRWFFSLIGILVAGWLIHWLRRTPISQKILAYGLIALLSGALGNLTERIVNGYVVDYLLFYWHPYYFPAFNLADTLICLGAAALLLDMWLNRAEQP